MTFPEYKVANERHNAALLEHDKQRQAVIDEMDRRGAEGQLWTNSQCAAWPAYQAALKEWREAQADLTASLKSSIQTGLERPDV